jgi:hypothetical protein
VQLCAFASAAAAYNANHFAFLQGKVYALEYLKVFVSFLYIGSLQYGHAGKGRRRRAAKSGQFFGRLVAQCPMVHYSRALGRMAMESPPALATGACNGQPVPKPIRGMPMLLHKKTPENPFGAWYFEAFKVHLVISHIRLHLPKIRRRP